MANLVEATGAMAATADEAHTADAMAAAATAIAVVVLGERRGSKEGRERDERGQWRYKRRGLALKAALARAMVVCVG